MTPEDVAAGYEGSFVAPDPLAEITTLSAPQLRAVRDAYDTAAGLVGLADRPPLLARVYLASAVLAACSGEVATARSCLDRANEEFGRAVAIAADFGPRLQALREKVELSRAALAAAVGLSAESIRLFETGSRRPTWDTVQALAAHFGVTTDTFRDR